MEEKGHRESDEDNVSVCCELEFSSKTSMINGEKTEKRMQGEIRHDIFRTD